MKDALTYLARLCYFFCLSAIWACQPQEDAFVDAICISNINTIDPIDGLKESQVVVIKDGKIVKIADANSLNLATSNKVIDGTDKYLIPGLWDAHVHFAYNDQIAPHMLDLFLIHGVTSVRDTGGELDKVKFWKDKASADAFNAPRVMMAGPLLDGVPNVYDGSDERHPELSVGLQTADDVEKQLHYLVNQKVDFFKAYEMLSPELFTAICKFAKSEGLKVTGHVPLSMDVVSASNAGLNSMEHMRNLELSCASNAMELLSRRRQLLKQGADTTGGALRVFIHREQREKAISNYSDSIANLVLAQLRINDTWQIPTLALNTLFTRKYFADTIYQVSYRLLPNKIGDFWLTRSRALENIPISEFRSEYDDWNYMMIKKIFDAEIPIMAGTDTPIAYLLPGLGLHKELAALVSAGIPPLDVLKTATYNPAKYFNLENKLGSIKEGMIADLVILTENPLDDIKNTSKIHTVFKNGKMHDAKALATIMQQLEAK